ncbi:HD domain-containing protein [Lentibacillus sp. CBA3610]|uniref:HD domain-containing protein n=1 Tax=Lentibacillus sp. CBA3610 TaxID=2518176 RepID=UPI001595D7AF|nr:HD domain-containing protein [Lentibacillus sp. CBA3610]QKY69170.1 HD domain-containing protein [Lentibacillus sp. CBA3610]
MDQVNQLDAIRDYVYTVFNNDSTGHDFFHMERVALMARHIAKEEQGDPFICEAAGWVHDIGDRKLFSGPQQAISDLYKFLQSIGCSNEDINRISTAAEDVSFSKGKIPSVLEGKIIQDADRLDAIGAIGIARTFAYGGASGQLIWYNEEELQQQTSIQHFYDKLLHLKDSMNTDTAKQIADQRHQFMETYLKQFFWEWQ